MDANDPCEKCQKCIDMGCPCRGNFPGSPTYVGVWANGPSNQGAWCECCVKKLSAFIKADPNSDLVTLAGRFLVTLAQHPDQYIREEPADPTGWTGGFPCWHPTDCKTMAKHIEKLKKSRSKFISRISKEMTGFSYAYWPFSYDQVNFSSPYPYIMTREVAAIILGPHGFDPAAYPPNPSVILPGGNRTKCPCGMHHS